MGGGWLRSHLAMPPRETAATATARRLQPNSSAPPSSPHASQQTSPVNPSQTSSTRNRDSESPTPASSIDDPREHFEAYNKSTFFRYKVEYDSQWGRWLERKSSYNGFLRDLKSKTRKKAIIWGNTKERTATAWSSFMEGASAMGVPSVRCIFCSAVMLHPTLHGNRALVLHIEKSKTCNSIRVREASLTRCCQLIEMCVASHH